MLSYSPYSGAAGKESACNAGDRRDAGLIPRSGRSPGGGHGNPLQYSCQENPIDRVVWWATVHGVAELDMTKQLTHTRACFISAARRLFLWLIQPLQGSQEIQKILELSELLTLFRPIILFFQKKKQKLQRPETSSNWLVEGRNQKVISSVSHCVIPTTHGSLSIFT